MCVEDDLEPVLVNIGTLTPTLVRSFHEVILQDGIGLAGEYPGKLEGALDRVRNKAIYEGMRDDFEIAAMFALAISQSHSFVDGNKRTGFTSALSYLELRGFSIPASPELEDMMVDLTEGKLDYQDFALYIEQVWFELHTAELINEIDREFEEIERILDNAQIEV